MKYLAILKDSLYEALDSKVLYFTLGLSLLVILLVGSLSFRPVAVEDQLNRMTGILNWVYSLAPEGKAPRVAIEDFERTNGPGEPWEGEYRFIFVIELPEGVKPEEIKTAKGRELSPQELQRQFQQGLSWAKKVAVTEKDSDNPRAVRYLIETWGNKVKDRREWPHDVYLFFGAVRIPPLLVAFFTRNTTLVGEVEYITDGLVGTFGAAVVMVLSTIITAFFIPNMLRRGTIDLLLAKPIHRITLLSYKYVGGLTFMFVNTAVIMVGLWLVLGMRTSLWVNGLLLCILIFTFQFAIFYAVSTLMGVLTQSPIVAILTSVGMWVLLFVVGITYRGLDQVRPEKVKDRPPDQRVNLPEWLFVTVDALHFVMPHYKDLDALTTQMIRRDLLDPDSPSRKEADKAVGSINWPESLIMTVFFIGATLGLASWRFATKDY